MGNKNSRVCTVCMYELNSSTLLVEVPVLKFNERYCLQ